MGRNPSPSHPFASGADKEGQTKKLILGTALAATTALPAFAQIAIEIAPEVREYVVREGRSSVTVEEEIAVGTPLPEEVEIYAIEDVPTDTPYRYAVVNERRVIVEPDTRRIIEIIE